MDHLNLHRRRIDDTLYMDTLFSKVKSLNGHTCAQLITNGSFTRIYPMESKASRNIAQALNEFVDNVGIPGALICDLATEQTGKNTEVLKAVRRFQIRLLPAEKGRGTTQNHRAETEIREVKTKWKTRMRENQVPALLWDYGLVYIAEVQLLLARGADQRPEIKKEKGQTIDILEWLDFHFYDRVWYWDQPKTDMTTEQAQIGRWLGIAHRVGSDMTYWVLTESGRVIARSTVQHITISDMATDAIQDRVTLFDATLLARLSADNYNIAHPYPVFYLQDDFDVLDSAVDAIPADAEYGDMYQPAKVDADDIEFDSFDQYLNSEFMVNQDGDVATAKVIKRAKDNSGNPIGKRHANPLLDTREYECELEDGTMMRYNANVIAENIFAQCDDAGRQQAILDEFIDHKRDGGRALRVDDGYVTTKRGRRVPKNTTKGWKILCQSYPRGTRI